MKKKIFLLLGSVFLIILLLIPIVGTIINVATIQYYDGRSPIRIISAGEARLAFICENGDLYISGYCWDAGLFGDDADGFDPPFMAILFYRTQVPKKLMENVSEISLSYRTGVIVDNDGKLYYFDMNNYRKPTFIRDGIVRASALDNRIYAITQDGTLFSIVPNGEEKEVMKDVAEVYADGAGVLVLNKAGSLYALYCGAEPWDDVAEFELIDTDVIQFSFTHHYLNSVQEAYVKSNGDLYVRGDAFEDFIEGEFNEFTKIKEGVKDVSIMQRGAIVQYADGSIYRLGKYFNEPSEIFIYQGEDCQITTGYNFAGVLDRQTGKLMLWGSSQIAFGEYRTHDYPFTGEPFVIGGKQ